MTVRNVAVQSPQFSPSSRSKREDSLEGLNHVVRIRRWLPTAAFAAVIAATTGAPPPPAFADPVPPANAGAPFAVEDGAYPFRSDVLAATGADLVAGDGGIMHTSCTSPHQIMLWARNLKSDESRICFKAANTGYLALNVSRAYRIETQGRDLNAQITVNGATSSISVPKDTSKGFGEASPTDPQQATLLEMRVTGSSTAPAQPSGDQTYAFAGKLAIGDNKRFCTATLVDPRWVLAAKSCFADKPAENNTVAAGAPKEKTTVTIGRTDLATAGHTTDIVDLVPHPDRDLVLARLSQPAFSVTPVAVSATAPTATEDITAVGFGRTKTEWAPSKLHAAVFSTGPVAATSYDLAPKTPADATLCKGDAGAPALRTENGRPALVGLISRAWQSSCLDTAPTDKTGAYATRTDGLTSWIASAKPRPVSLKGGETLAPGQMLASEEAQLVMQTDGNLVLYHVTGGDGKGGALWQSGTSGNPGAFARMQSDGNFVVYKKGTVGNDPSGALWASGTYQNTDARLDLQSDANLVVYTKNGGHGLGGALWYSDTISRGNKLTSGAKLMPGSWLSTGDKVLIMDIQGDILLRERGTNRTLWSKITSNPYAYLHMQADSNLVLYKQGTNTGALWASNTVGGTGSYATLEDNGSLVVRWSTGGERWISSSLQGEQSSRCLDSDNGTSATIWDCWGGVSQQWDHTPAKELRVNGNKCLTADTGANQGAKVTTTTCDGRAEQKWNVNSDKTITAALNPGQCMNVNGQATANGSTLGLWGCNGGANTKWKRP